MKPTDEIAPPISKAARAATEALSPLSRLGLVLERGPWAFAYGYPRSPLSRLGIHRRDYLTRFPSVPSSHLRRGGSDIAWDVWVTQECEGLNGERTLCALSMLHNPDAQSSVWATRPHAAAWKREPYHFTAKAVAVAYNLKAVLEPALEVVRLASGQFHRAVSQVSISQR